MRARIVLSVAMVAILAVAAAANATVVYTFSGAEVDTAADWRTATVAKSYDADANNVYGSDGYIEFGNRGPGVLPSYMSSINITDTTTYTNADTFALCDDPATTPGPSPSKTYLTCTHTTTANNVNHLNFTVNASVPASFSVSVLTDAAGDTGFVPTAIQLGGPDGSVGVTTTNRNNAPDMYVFTITGAQANDYFEIWSSPGTHWNVHDLAAVGFDTAPEPSVLVLLITGVIGLLAYAWRKRK
jgi:hypothetical protein